MIGKIELRRQQRISLRGYAAIFIDNDCNFTGTLQEISLNGLRVNIFPTGSQLIFVPILSWFNSTATWNDRKVGIIITESVPEKEYKLGYCPSRPRQIYMLSASPRWQKRHDTLMEIGFEIPKSSAAWKIFVQQKMPEIH
ncbi:MAG: hypothetical protein D3910_09935 [Candidatus Electrothrix sp. ATG2]|nr:hypothetical protein [Candidatus Electrothrix sp. ATG2]